MDHIAHANVQELLS